MVGSCRDSPGPVCSPHGKCKEGCLNSPQEPWEVAFTQGQVTVGPAVTETVRSVRAAHWAPCDVCSVSEREAGLLPGRLGTAGLRITCGGLTGVPRARFSQP